MNSAETTAHDLAVVFSRLKRRMLETAPSGDLTPSQRSVLSRLSKGGPATLGELAAAERVRSQSMAATVQVLESAGLVVRSDDPNDGRRRILDLSPQGRSLIEGMRTAWRSWLAEALAQTCTAEELATLQDAIGILDRVVDS